MCLMNFVTFVFLSNAFLVCFSANRSALSLSCSEYCRYCRSVESRECRCSIEAMRLSVCVNVGPEKCLDAERQNRSGKTIFAQATESFDNS